MNIVIVKHFETPKKYLFQVPSGNIVKNGDIVKVDTASGKRLAVCLCDAFTVEEDFYEEMLESFGAQDPLRYVTGKYIPIDFDVPELNESTEEEQNTEG